MQFVSQFLSPVLVAAYLIAVTAQAGAQVSTTEVIGLTLTPRISNGGLKSVVIVGVDPTSEAADKGLKLGDVILEINGETVHDPLDVVEGIMKENNKAGRRSVLLRVKSGGEARFVGLRSARKLKLN